MKIKLFSLLFFLFAVSFELLSQSTPLAVRKTWDGPYDIKMIAAPNLQAVYLNESKATANTLFADSVISYKTMLMSGKGKLSINNAYKSGSPFLSAKIPYNALYCPDANAACS